MKPRIQFLQLCFRLFQICLCFLSFSLGAPGTLFGACNCTAIPATCPGPAQPGLPCVAPILNNYILRFSTVGLNGQIVFIGNTLGLSKAECFNDIGTFDAIGAFSTTDPTMIVGSYPSVPALNTGGPAGTSIDWTQNGSTAVLDSTTFPPGSTILYAELIWSGSYGYYCSNPASGNPIGANPACVLAFADGPISFTTADGQVHAIVADPITAQNSQNPAADVQPFYCGGNYVRSANVTALFSMPSLANPLGTYMVSGIPATVSQFDETHNAAGWTLAIVFQDPSLPAGVVNNISFFVAAQQAQNTQSNAAEVSGFCTPPTGPQNARILISAIEGDAGTDKDGDSMRFASTILNLALAGSRLSGPNNIVDNFFASQINDSSGNLITTSGTFCNVNQNPALRNVPGARQGYDITNVDGSAQLVANQTTAFTLATTSGDDYLINALGVQIQVLAPVIVPMKKVNGQNSVNANVGDTVTFTITIDNTAGLGNGENVVFIDVLETGLIYVPGTFKIDNVLQPDPNLTTGVPLGNINAGVVVTLEYQVLVSSMPVSGNVFHNFGTASFGFTSCQTPVITANNSNIVSIILPTPPGNFNGVIKKCEFINKTKHTLTATWDPFTSSDIVAYRIYKNGQVVATVPASGPLVFETCLHSKNEANQFSLVAVSSNNMESAPINIRIIHE
ncbi:MAG: isopeptide-forming domain-containing fimbrial protein [Rhabdochlamydiaceae bacterium]|nr:isopeptide-forming domain-containing fimbrial protein [Rhabdochlamydiaceae bacterium]